MLNPEHDNAPHGAATGEASQENRHVYDSAIMPDLAEAARFFTLLDEDAEAFTVQTFSDRKSGKFDGKAKMFHAPFDAIENELIRINQGAGGIFVAVNETDLQGREKSNIVRIRAIWQDDDEGWHGTFPLEPHIVVATSPGKFQRYWLADGLSVEDHQALMSAMVANYGSDPNAKDIARVLRVPGFLHCKDEPVLVRIVAESGALPYSRDELMAAFEGEKFFSHAKSSEQSSRPSQSSHIHNGVATEGKRNAFLTSQAGAMQRRGMAPDAILAALREENTAKCQPPLDDAEVVKIAESIGRYEPEADPLVDIAIVEDALAKIKANSDDPRPLYDPAVQEALKRLRADDRGEWARLRCEIKRHKPKGMLLSDIDEASADPSTQDESTVADEIVNLIAGEAELTHDDQGRPYATFDNGETYPLDTQAFRDLASYRFYSSTKENTGHGLAPSDTALRTAITTLAGIAKHEGDESTVYIRCAPIAGGYALDLGALQPIVEVLSSGWRLVKNPSTLGVKFWRPSTSAALPIPITGGDISLLWKYANIPSLERALVIAWILDCWRSDTPFPIIELCGQQGTAKSSTQERLRQIVDPNAVNLRAAPKCVEDIFVTAGCNWLVSFNNLSHLSPQMQDALCNLATDGGFASRTLFSNADETVIKTRRPVIINGIVPTVTAQDLSDRLIHVELPEIAYREESELDAEFEKDLPHILGGLLDLFVGALRELPKVKLDRLPRMADFTRWGEAVAIARGAPAGAFVKLFEDNRRQSVARGLEASPVATAIREYVETTFEPAFPGYMFEGNLKLLLDKLEKFKKEGEAWPRSPRGLSDILRRQRPALRTIGIAVDLGGHGRNGVTATIKWAKS